MPRPLFAGASAVLLWLGCVSTPPPPPADLDPSNPDAPTSPPITVRAFPAPAPVSEPAPAPSSPTAPAPAGAYTCPMHPEVVSDSPGRCPKCKMKLVPTKPAEEPAPSGGGTQGGHEHEHPGGHR